MPRLLAALLAAGLLAPAAAVAADGDPPPGPPATTYMNAFRITAEGSGTYDRHDQQLAAGLGYDETVGAAFSYKVTLPMVWFDDRGHLVGDSGHAGGPAAPGSVLSGAGTSHLVLHTAEGNKFGDCAAALQDVAIPTMQVDRLGAVPADDGEDLVITPVRSILLAADCGGLNAGLNLVPVAGIDSGAMDQAFHMAKEDLDQEKVVVPVKQTAIQSAPAMCPGREGDTISCSFHWTGKVTFERVNNIELDPGIEIGTEHDHPHDEDGGGAPAPGPTPAPPTPPAPVPPVAGGTPTPPSGPGVPAPRVRVKGVPRLDLAHRRAIVVLSCPAACQGKVYGYAKDRRVAAQDFTARAGRPTTVAVALNAAARRALGAGAKAMRLVVAVGDTRTTVTATATATATARRR